LARHPDVKFVIAGKGPMMEEWKNKAQRLGYGDKVLFAGFVSDEDRNRLLRNAAVTVFPSLYEPFGIVALEAMTAGSPVVVSDVGGLADVVEHGQNGLKMYAGDARSLATQVNVLLDDPVWAQHLAEAGRQSVKQYDWSRIAQQTITVYQRVLGKMSHHDHTEEILVPSLTK
jgi:1,4-alpha-glucan branching enzyme